MKLTEFKYQKIKQFCMDMDYLPEQEFFLAAERECISPDDLADYSDEFRARVDAYGRHVPPLRDQWVARFKTAALLLATAGVALFVMFYAMKCGHGC